jgi:hypothetical protein
MMPRCSTKSINGDEQVVAVTAARYVSDRRDA